MARGSVTCLIIFVVFCSVLNAKENSDIKLLNENTWSDMLNDEWMVEFYAPWCPACKGLEGTWHKFAKWGKEMGLNVGQVDVTASPGLSGRFMVTALPTIFHVIDGQFRQYKGSRDIDSFMSFVVERKWEQVETVPYWKSPNSPQMSIVATFFKLSQFLRNTHTKLMEEYGLPTWGSYLIFAVATILLGGLMGLVMVLVIDILYPPVGAKQSNNAKKPKVKPEGAQDSDWESDNVGDDLYNDMSSDENEDGDDNKKDDKIPSSNNTEEETSTKRRKARRDC